MKGGEVMKQHLEYIYIYSQEGARVKAQDPGQKKSVSHQLDIR